MRKITAIIACFWLVGCTQHGQPQTAKAQSHVACPVLQASSGYTARSTLGIDARTCKLSPLRAEALPAELYIGNFPPNQPNLQFDTFAPSPFGTLTWFESRPRPDSRDFSWVTYIATGNNFPAVIQLVVHSRTPPTPEQLARIASLALSGSIRGT
jgi:hypothetical protein